MREVSNETQAKAREAHKFVTELGRVTASLVSSPGVSIAPEPIRKSAEDWKNLRKVAFEDIDATVTVNHEALMHLDNLTRGELVDEIHGLMADFPGGAPLQGAAARVFHKGYIRTQAIGNLLKELER